jgi:cytochrome c553
VVTLNRLPASPPPGIPANHAAFGQACSQCHGPTGGGSSAPPLARQSQLADLELLKKFLATVPPPMPRLYPGLMDDNDVQMIAEYLKTNVFKCGPKEIQSCEPPTKPKTGGTAEWRNIYSVLTSPRCINCHPVSSNLPTYAGYPQDYPRQGDDRHPHYYSVLRGDVAANGAGMGTPFERCTSCHGIKNDPKTGIPGTTNPASPDLPFWELAPAAMAWEAAPGVPLDGAELCARLKDPTRNGNRSLSDLLEHLKNEPLVNWAWNPGTRLNGEARTTPPISHAVLIEEFQKWMADDAPCPAAGDDN